MLKGGFFLLLDAASCVLVAIRAHLAQEQTPPNAPSERGGGGQIRKGCACKIREGRGSGGGGDNAI